jgi:tetratricopeptide (TPR) repeat protein
MLVSLFKRARGVRRDGDQLRAQVRDGYSRLQAGDAPGAKRIAQDLLTQDPTLIGAHLLLAQAAADGGDWDVAFSAIERILAMQPNHADAYFIRGMMHEQRGSAERAIADLARVLEIDPSHALALDRKGALHDSRGEFNDSLVCAERLVGLDRTNADAHHKRGITLRELGRLVDAEHALRTAVELDSKSPDARSHLALVLIDQGRFEEGDELLCDTLGEQTDHADARWTRAVLNLLRGRFDLAWDDYEWRETKREKPSRVDGVPHWDGTPIDRGSLLIFAEQGLGDQIMFASCLEDALSLCPKCVIECDARLEALFRRSFPRATVVPADKQHPPRWLQDLTSPITAQLSIASLPRRFRSRTSDFPTRERYLIPDSAKVVSWRERLQALGPGPKIGLSWTGGTAKTRRSLRSVPLEQLLPVLRAGPGCHFVNLQYVDSKSEVSAMSLRHGITVHDFQEINESYDETAAFMGALDLVISVCTSAIHLAGAIGTPVWIIASAAPEWRYLASGKGMPWYSSAKIWRQKELGEWGAVIQAIARELASFSSMHAKGKAHGRSA